MQSISSKIFSAIMAIYALASKSVQQIVGLPLVAPYADKLMDFVVDNRGWFTTFFILPLSFVYENYNALYRRWERWTRAASKHDERVRLVQRQVREAPKGKMLCTARPARAAMSIRFPNYKGTKYVPIDMNNLDNILSMDEERGIVKVEPMCTMGQITHELLPTGWTLQVTPELDSLTVGGLINGFGVETSSHKYGLFQHTCVSYEIVLPNGELVRCSQHENPELFAAIPWSHGTIGFLTAVEIKCVKAKKYVELEYIPCTDLDTVCDTFIKASRTNSNDFVELLMYSRTSGIVMVGKMTDKAVQSRVNKIGLWYKPWFYKHVETFFQKGRSVEYVPLRDYYHRHTKSLFWEMQDIVPFGNNPIYRFLTGWLGAPHVQWFKMTTVGKLKELYDKHHVVQDMLVPINTLKESLEVFYKEFNLYPMWVCPMRLLTPPMDKSLIQSHKVSNKFVKDEQIGQVTAGPGGLVNPLPTEQLYVDIGAYGNPASPTYDYKKSLRAVEEYVRKVNGYQALYADTMMTRDELRMMFDHRLYDKMRKQYGCVERLPEFYDKVCRAART